MRGCAWGAFLLLCFGAAIAAAADNVRQSLESSARTRVLWLDLETSTGTTGDIVYVPEVREVYRRFQGDYFFKAEGALSWEQHERNAALDIGTVRADFQAGVHVFDYYWLAEWRTRYVGRDGFEDTLTRQNFYGVRVRKSVLPEPPEGVRFDIQPVIGAAYIDAWPDRLDRWSGDAELEFLLRLDSLVMLTVAPKIEWIYYPDFSDTTREDLIESLRVSTRFRLAPGWAFTIEAQISQVQSTAPGADSFGVSVLPLVRNVVRF